MAELLSVAIEEKRYGNANAALLRGVRLTLHSGEIAAVTGRSGCGKTTLLNIIAGLDGDYRGQIAPPPSEKRAATALMFQEPLLLPWLTVRENIALVLPRTDAADIADKWIDAVGLGGWENAYPRRLSLGMARRAALARALATEPRLLLLDEPFVSLDEPAAAQLRILLLDLLAQTDAAAIFVTHNLREALIVADRLIIIGKGESALLADDVINPPRSVRRHKDLDGLAAALSARYAELNELPPPQGA
jgi:NitT/TauT family transport system ATP-binding protein